MTSPNRIIINTITQYTRTVVNIVLSLYSSRLVLSYLGASDFGIYSLVAGVVSMLSFLTNSMVVSTQRFISVCQGSGDNKEVERVFNNSLILHLFLGVIVAVLFIAMEPLLFNGFLNIPPERTSIAIKLYLIVVVVLLFSVINSPFRALLISHENIVYLSVVDVIDGVLKLTLVLLLPHISLDKLLTYGIITLFIQLFNFVTLSSYSFTKYSECKLPKLSGLDKEYIQRLAGFTGWVTLSHLCLVGRNQGFAIVLNKVMGTIVNAAYGIANQISGYLNFLSSSVATAVNPQLMRTLGAKDYPKMMKLTEFQSKVGYLMFCMVAIPMVFEIKTILTIWLGKYPECTAIFSVMIIIGSLVDQPTYGLTSALQAIGRLKRFTLFFYLPKLMVLPISCILLLQGMEVKLVVVTYIIVEFFCCLIRMWVFKMEFPSFEIKRYLQRVFGRLLLPTLFDIVSCILVIQLYVGKYRFFVTFAFSMAIFVLASYFFSLNVVEKKYVKNMATSLLKKFRKHEI